MTTGRDSKLEKAHREYSVPLRIRKLIQYHLPPQIRAPCREVTLRVAVNDDNLFPLVGEHPAEIEGSRRLANSAFVIEKRDLFCHRNSPIGVCFVLILS